MTPRSYEFTCRVCGKSVTESSDNEVCATCVMNPGAAPRPAAPPPPPPPVSKSPIAPPKKGGFSISIRTVSVCKACKGKGVMDGAPCLVCGGRKR
ncbi:MAG: hypothetical protein HY928_16875 [Elusimicrobia bacterium]|nr:hypothetical protein [Elusimicrobiota bacterium]